VKSDWTFLCRQHSVLEWTFISDRSRERLSIETRLFSKQNCIHSKKSSCIFCSVQPYLPILFQWRQVSIYLTAKNFVHSTLKTKVDCQASAPTTWRNWYGEPHMSAQGRPMRNPTKDDDSTGDLTCNFDAFACREVKCNMAALASNLKSDKCFLYLCRATLYGVKSRKAYHLDGLHIGFRCRQPKKNVTFHMTRCLCHISTTLVRHKLQC
jgi:hypothetical protein